MVLMIPSRNHKTLPYEHSVDTWSFAAVLYHLLCGRAPFAGAHEAQMLMNVMSLPVDWDRLKQAGISDGGVDFVQKMLVTDPSQRARDDVLLEHPWLISASQIPDLEQGEAEELDASQLSLADSGENEGDGLDYYDDMEDAREHKRIRPWLQEGGQRDVWGEIVSRHQIGITGLAPSMSQPPPPQRLFGEIGTSALRSLGVLGQTAQVALQAPGAGSYDPLAFRAASGGSYDPSAFRAAGGGSHDLTVLGAPGGGSYDPAVFGAPGDGSYNSSSASASYMNPEATSAEDVSYIDPGHVSAHPTNEGVTPQNIQYPQLVPGSAYNIGAPSLLGTEALVGQLNMASPESGVSGPSVDSKRASPKTPHSRELSPTLPGSKRPSQDIRPSEDEISLKRSKTNRTPSSPSTRRQSDEASARYATYGSQTGGEGDDHASRARKEAAQPVKCNDTWQSTDCDDHHDGQQARERTKSNMSMPPTAFNSQDWAHDPNDGDKAISKPASRRQSASSNTAGKATSRHQSPANKSIPPSITYTRPTSAGKGPVIAVSDDADFVKPPMIFGNLIAIKGSVPTVHKIKITSRITTFGRALDSSFIHQNSREDRVPKNAIDIQMWYPNIEKDIAAGRDPYNKKELTAIISTRTSRYIKVNGIRLMRGKGCWLYGELRTGDIVSIFELPEESKVMKPEDNEFLRFRCEFYVGASREARKEGHPFKVEKEEEKYNQNVARKSCESTEAVDLIADNNDKGNGQGSNTATKAT